MFHGVPASPRESFPSNEDLERRNAARHAAAVASPDPRGYACHELDADGRPVQATCAYPTIDEAGAALARIDPDGERGWYVDVAPARCRGGRERRKR